MLHTLKVLFLAKYHVRFRALPDDIWDILSVVVDAILLQDWENKSLFISFFRFFSSLSNVVIKVY